MFDYLQADIICFQETRLQARDFEQSHAIVPGYTSYYTFATSKKGYSGVALYVKAGVHVFKAEEGLTGWMPDLATKVPYRNSPNPIGGYTTVSESEGRYMDAEGRAITLELSGDVVVLGLYCPANSQGTNHAYRTRFFELLDGRIEQLQAEGKRVIVMGDLNVTLEPRDSAETLQKLIKSGRITASLKPNDIPDQITQEWQQETLPRRVVCRWVKSLGLVDTTRAISPQRENMFTCWNQLLNMRPANFGSRIDFILADSRLSTVAADILPDLMGSDHCPVYADLKLPPVSSSTPPRTPALSRKRCQGFGQDIKSMFAARSGAPFRASPTASPAIEQERIQKTPFKSPKPAQKKLTRFFTMPADQRCEPQHADSPSVSNFDRPGTDNLISDAGVKVPSPDYAHFYGSSLDHEASQIPANGDTTGASRKPPGSEQWSKIFSLKKPLCFHEEDCVMQVTKKSGPNKGRPFWSCRRAQGAEGDTNFKCKYFKWA